MCKHELNPVDFVQRSALIEPEKEAVVSGDKRFTYAQFADRVRSLAWYFKSNGYKRIAILAPNTVAHLETLFAANVSGGIIMGLNYRLTKNQIEYMLNLGEADFVVVDYEYKDLVVDNKIPSLVDFDFTTEQCPYSQAIKSGAQVSDQWPQNKIDEFDTLGLFFTSGTTGNPKAVEYSYRGVYLAAMGNVIESKVTSDCKYLWTLPLFHAAGWTFPYAVTSVRGTHFCIRKVDPDLVWDLLRFEKITHFNAAPTVNMMLLNSEKAVKLEQQVKVTVAASPPSAKLFQDMTNKNLHPVHMYGLTETYGPFAVCYFNKDWLKLSEDEMYANMARQGFAYITSEKLQVLDSETGNPVKKDGKQIGEITVSGNIVAKGYYKNPEETEKSFGNGYFRSGDLAVMHPDGSCQVLDRKKDIIISGGENISSVAVENVLIKHPAILEVAVVGVPHQLYGETPIACVVLKEKVSIDKLIQYAKEHLGGYQVPRKMYLVEEIPKTVTGKVKKNVLRDMYHSQVKL